MCWIFLSCSLYGLITVHITEFCSLGVFSPIITPDRSDNFYVGFKELVVLSYNLRQKPTLGIKGMSNIYSFLTSFFAIPGRYLHVFPTQNTKTVAVFILLPFDFLIQKKKNLLHKVSGW